MYNTLPLLVLGRSRCIILGDGFPAAADAGRVIPVCILEQPRAVLGRLDGFTLGE